MMKQLSLFLLCLLGISFSAYGQETSVDELYGIGQDFIEIFESADLEVVHIEMDVLSEYHDSELTTRYFSGKYTYFIMAYSDEGIADMDVSLSDGDNILAESDDFTSEVDDLFEDLSVSERRRINMLIYEPEEGDNLLLFTTLENLAAGERAGRYFLFVAHTLEEEGSNSDAGSDEDDENTYTFDSDYTWDVTIDRRKRGTSEKVKKGQTRYSIFKVNIENENITQITLGKNKRNTIVETYDILSLEDEGEGYLMIKVLSSQNEVMFFEMVQARGEDYLQLTKEVKPNVFEGIRFAITEE